MWLLHMVLLCLFPLSENISATAHDFHMSKCQIEYSQEDKALQVTLHIFIDDLEEALRKEGADKLFICTEKEDKKADEHLVKYLEERLVLQVNDQPANFTFVGKEPSEDLQAAWCYLEFTNIDQLTNLTVTYDLLMELFDDQKNIVSVMTPGHQQAYFLFEKGKSEETLSFN